MGTETSPPSGAYKMIGIVYVKLNNPLMGTETFIMCRTTNNIWQCTS